MRLSPFSRLTSSLYHVLTVSKRPPETTVMCAIAAGFPDVMVGGYDGGSRGLDVMVKCREDFPKDTPEPNSGMWMLDKNLVGLSKRAIVEMPFSKRIAANVGPWVSGGLGVPLGQRAYYDLNDEFYDTWMTIIVGAAVLYSKFTCSGSTAPLDVLRESGIFSIIGGPVVFEFARCNQELLTDMVSEEEESRGIRARIAAPLVMSSGETPAPSAEYALNEDLRHTLELLMF